MAVNLFTDEQAALAEAAPAIARKRALKERVERETARIKEETTIDQIVDVIHKHARRADNAQAGRDESRERNRQAAIDNADLDTEDPLQDVGQLLMVAVIPAAYLLDYFLFNNFVTYMLAASQPSESYLFWARLIAPAVVVMVEVVLATLLYAAWRKADTWRDPAFIAWGALSVATMLGFSLITAATMVASEGAASMWDLTAWEVMLLVPATVFSAIPHALLLFSGRTGYYGKVLVYKNGRRWWIRRLDRRYTRQADKAVASFRYFARRVNDYRAVHGHNPWSDPRTFTDIARRIINERLGEEVIPLPTAHRGNGLSSFRALFDQPPDGMRQQDRGDL